MRKQALEKWGHSHHFAIDTAQSEKKVTIVFATLPNSGCC